MRKQETASTREAFVASLLDVACDDPTVALVCAESAKSLGAMSFAERHPSRFFDVGIAEQTAVAFAAGLAASGLRPFVGAYASFLTMRACEQVRTFVAYPCLNVKFAGMNGGLYGGEREGTAHQSFEDIAILRSIPGMEIVVPADAGQTRKVIRAMAVRNGPAYLRLGSGREPIIFDDDFDFEFGRARVLDERGRDAALLCNGPIVNRVLQASKTLANNGIRTTVVEVHTLKPLDTGTLLLILQRCGAAVTVEDHSVVGGLGSAVAELIAENALPISLTRVGLQDIFPSSGEAEEVLDFYGMSPADIVAATWKAIRRKSVRTYTDS